MNLTDFDALSFDCYGTLIDWESGMAAALEPLAARSSLELSRDQMLEAHGRHEAAQELQTPTKLYRDLLAVVYRRLAEEWRVPVSWSECVEYGRTVGDWRPFEDTVEALRYLKQHYKLIILSNVDNDSFSRSHEKLGVEFDAIYTAEDIGSYKPSDRNFEFLLEHAAAIGVERSRLLHTAESLFHDHVPAERHRISSCWIYRRWDQEGFGATKDPGQVPDISFRFNSLAEFAAAHQAELDRER